MRYKRLDIMNNDDNNILETKLYQLYNNEIESSGGSLDKAKAKLYDIIKNELSPNQANVLSMYYFDNMKQQDIANILGIKQPTVCRTIKRAKEKLAKILKYII